MYDLAEGSDSSREWIEIFNAGSIAVMLSDWRLFEADANHRIGAYEGGESIPMGAYAIIADDPDAFRVDHPNFSGLLFDSAFSLSNTGEVLVLRDQELVDKDSVSYEQAQGGAGDGNSLQRTSVAASVFAPSPPTPGEGQLQAAETVNEADQEDTEETVQDGEREEEKGGPEADTAEGIAPIEPQVFAYAGEDRVVIVGADTKFQGRAADRAGKPVENARFLWNFGDGSTAKGESVLHHFSHPGRYAVFLHIAENKYASADRIIVEAKPADIGVHVVANGHIALENQTTRDLNLSFWHVRSGGELVRLPEHTVILAGETVVFDREVTGLAPSIDTALLYPNGEVAAEQGSIETLPEVSVTASPEAVAETNLTAPLVSRTSASPQRVIGIAIPPRETPRPSAEEETAVSLQLARTEAAEEGTDSSAQSAAVSVASAAASDSKNHLWFIAVGALAILSATAAVIARRQSKNEWTIIEEAED